MDVRRTLLKVLDQYLQTREHNAAWKEFFREELNVDIYDDHWAVQGRSKANRLRSYLRRADPRTALDALNAR